MHYDAIGDGVDHVTVVHDLGGTTLDVTVLHVRGRNVTITGAASLPLGGRSWDAALARALLGDLGDPDAALTPAVLRAAEAIRIGLGERDQVTGSLPTWLGEREVRVDRERFAAITGHLIDRMAEFTRATISDAARSADPAETLLLAGGASLMPAVPRALAERLALEVRADNPQLAVVSGLTLAADFGLLFTIDSGDAPSLRPPAGRNARSRPARPQSPAADPEPTPADPEPASFPDPEPASFPDTGSPATVPGPGSPVSSPDAGSPAVSPDMGPAVPAMDAVPEPGWAAPADATASAAPGHPQTAPVTPAAPDSAGVATTVPGAAPPGAAPLTGHPVRMLSARRRGEHVLLTWIWPDDSVVATVRWQTDDDGLGRHGSARCTRREYEHDGGFGLRIGRSGATITVEALSYAVTLAGDPPSVTRVESAPTDVTYQPEVLRKKLRTWTVAVTFTTDAVYSLPPLLVVRGDGGYRPESTRDGIIVCHIPAQLLTPGMPASIPFDIDRPRGTCWLVCLPADDNPAAACLRPAHLHRLRVN
jgi:hypothetical protein